MLHLRHVCSPELIPTAFSILRRWPGNKTCAHVISMGYWYTLFTSQDLELEAWFPHDIATKDIDPWTGDPANLFVSVIDKLRASLVLSLYFCISPPNNIPWTMSTGIASSIVWFHSPDGRRGIHKKGIMPLNSRTRNGMFPCIWEGLFNMNIYIYIYIYEDQLHIHLMSRLLCSRVGSNCRPFNGPGLRKSEDRGDIEPHCLWESS